MHSVPISLFLILFVQTTTGVLSLPSLPEAVQLLQLETIRGLEQTILEKEDENRRLEEMIRSVEMENKAVTHNNTMVQEEMERALSERETIMKALENRLQFLEKDGTIGALEERIQGLMMEKAAIEKQNAIEKEENVQRMIAMESEKTQMREEFAKKQMEIDASCQDEKREIEDLKNEELDEISEGLDQSEMTVRYMSEVMLHSNQVMEEQENLLKVQAGAIQEFNEIEEVKMGRNCSTLLGAAADRVSLQEEAIDLLKSSLIIARNFSELSTSGMDQLDVAPFMIEMIESYNQLAEMIENMKTALEKEGQIEAQTPELLIHLAGLRSALESASINMDMLEQQAKLIEMQGRSIALLTPLLRRSNSSDILWFENTSRTLKITGEIGVADVAACSCLPRSASTNQLRPVKIDYQCQGDTNRSFQLPCPGGVCSSRELPSCTGSLEWEEEEVGFEKCQELSFNGASVLCGVNGTKETTRRLHIGGGIVEEVVTAPCNDCGDLSAALEWTAWTPCADETIEGMLCRTRGNIYMGFEEEQKDPPKCCIEDSNLVSAAMEGNLEKVQNLLRFVDPNSVKIVDNNQKTYALHEAARRGHVKIMMALIAAGADVDIQYQRNGELWDTALHIAVFHGQISAVKTLVASGASSSIMKHQNGREIDTPVMVALGRIIYDKTNENKWHIFKHLVRNGAPLDFNLLGQSARDLSAKLGWVIPDQY